MDENTILAFAEARLDSECLRVVEAHAGGCMSCHDLLRHALKVSGLAHTVATQRLGATPEPRGGVRAPLAQGTSIGRYTVLKQVGRGGMGEVYSAYDPALDRQVAVKLLHAEAGSDHRAQERLLREGQAIAQLSHPNVVVVHDMGTLGAQVFVAMEFVDGPTLAMWLIERQRSWREILGVFLQAARGLSAAHRVGFVHRDFKPQNVMLGRDGTVRVTDFGLATRIGELAGTAGAHASGGPEGGGLEKMTLTLTGERLGTPYFMAPEQFRAGKTDARSDQFSFCVALYWALFGVHPFGGSNPMELARNVAGGKLTQPQWKSTAPVWLQRALVRGMSVDPADRWSSVDALAAALSADPNRKRRSFAIAGTTLILMIALGLWGVKEGRSPAAQCQAGPSHMAGVWELDGAAGSRRGAVRAAIERSGVTGAQYIWKEVASLFDQYAARWLAAYRDACEATHVRGEQSEDVMDLRMACLNDDLDSARALTRLLSSGETRVIGGAVDAAAALDDLSRCTNIALLRSDVPPPKDAMIRAEVATLRSRLKEAQALWDVGNREGAGKIANAVLQRAEAIGYCPLRAEALVIEGDVIVETGNRDVLETALDVGETCGDDRVVARAATELVYEYARSNDQKLAERSAALANAALARIGNDKRLQSWLANNLVLLRIREGRLEEARAEAEKAVTLKKELLGPDHRDVAISTAALGAVLGAMGEFPAALSAVDSALTILSLRASEVLVNALTTRGDILLGLDRIDEAEKSYRQAQRREGQLTPSQFSAAQVQVGLGRVALARGRATEAVEYLELALAPRSSELSINQAEIQLYLAKALDLSHRDQPRALDLAQKALATYSGIPAIDWRRRREAEVLVSRLRSER